MVDGFYKFVICIVGVVCIKGLEILLNGLFIERKNRRGSSNYWSLERIFYNIRCILVFFFGVLGKYRFKVFL